MATTLTINTLAGPYDGTLATPTFESPTTTTQAIYSITGDEIVVAENTGTVANNFRLVSTDDTHNRKEDITFSVPASTTVAKKMERTGWEDSNGNMAVSLSSSDLNVSIWRIP